MPYSTLNDKKFLDANGLAYFSSKLNNYPTNDILEAVIEGIQDALSEKLDADQVGVANGVASLTVNGIVPYVELPIEIGNKSELNAKVGYVPARGQIIIYLDKGTISRNNITRYVPGIKVGDGNAYLADLPFVGDDEIQTVLYVLQTHIDDTDSHVSSADRTRWDNKLNYTISGETLIFNRL